MKHCSPGKKHDGEEEGGILYSETDRRKEESNVREY